jgi:hypothetical protein
VSFQAGDQVEVLDAIRGVWIPAVVVMRWRCVRVEGDDWRLFLEYGCDGMDGDSPFHGRWTEAYVRRRTEAA